MEDCDRGKTERRIARAERIVARQTERQTDSYYRDFRGRRLQQILELP